MKENKTTPFVPPPRGRKEEEMETVLVRAVLRSRRLQQSIGMVSSPWRWSMGWWGLRRKVLRLTEHTEEPLEPP